MRSEFNKFRSYKYAAKPKGPVNIDTRENFSVIDKLIIITCFCGYGAIMVFVGLVLGGFIRL